MSKFSLVLAAGVVCAAAFVPALAASNGGASVPDFSSNDIGWTGAGENEFKPPASGPGPVTDDPAHPYVSNFTARQTGQQPNWRVANLDNPNLKPWVVEALRTANQEALAGRAVYTREARCWPTGVPAMLQSPTPIYFVQTLKDVWILQEADHRVRHILLDQPHSAHPIPSWYGESVGHYEGDTLVVDTIGMNDKTFVDNYRTPHTTALHVVERFRLANAGKSLEAAVTVEDPGAFNTNWSEIKVWARVKKPLDEVVCAENVADYFNDTSEPLPHSDRPDF